MNPVEAFFAGIAPQHAPALIAVLLLPVLLVVVRRLAPTVVARPRSAVERWAAALLAISGVVHLALPLGHFDGPLLTVAFLGSGVAFIWLALRVWEGKSWRLLTALLTAATLIAYLSVAGTGGEEHDQVGIATALVELAAFGFAVVPGREPGRPHRFGRFAGSAATVTAVVLVGAIIWVGSFLAHQAAETGTAAAGTAMSAGTAPAVGHSHEHGHDHAGRAQAGVIMRPGGDHHPTAGELKAAGALASGTRKAMARYADLNAALAAGYRIPGAQATGTDVHLENPDYTKDGRVLDPQRPEMLVYSIMDDRATLLGVVYVMQVAGRAAPEPGGPVTRWHAHNICVSLLPPGLGIVSPYGGCPAFSVNLTSPEMMHVWVVDNPAGPYADGLDAAWVRRYHAEHARSIG